MIDQPALECEHPEQEIAVSTGASRHGEKHRPKADCQRGAGPDPLRDVSHRNMELHSRSRIFRLAGSTTEKKAPL